MKSSPSKFTASHTFSCFVSGQRSFCSNVRSRKRFREVFFFTFSTWEHEASSALTYGPSNNYVILMLKAERSVKATLAHLNCSAHIATRVSLAAKELLMIYRGCLKPLYQIRWLLAINKNSRHWFLTLNTFSVTINDKHVVWQWIVLSLCLQLILRPAHLALAITLVQIVSTHDLYPRSLGFEPCMVSCMFFTAARKAN